MTDQYDSLEVDQELFAAAIDRHDDLPYHNVEHMLDVAEYGQELIDRCKSYNAEVDEDDEIEFDEAVVYMAILFHDAAYATDLDEHIFSSKEEYSAQVARTYLSIHNHDRTFVDAVADTINATHPDAVPETVEAKIVRAADLRGLMADYETFHENAVLLREEAELLGEPMTDQGWVENVVRTVQSYLDDDIRLTPAHDTDDGRSEFHVQAEANLERFEADYWHLLTPAGAD